MKGITQFHLSAFFFVLGVVGAQTLPFENHWVFVCPFVLLVVFLASNSNACALFGFLIGILWVSFRADQILSTSLPPDFESLRVQVMGTVSGYPQGTNGDIKFNYDIESITIDQQVYPYSLRVQLRWYQIPPAKRLELVPNSFWKLTVKLKRPHGYYNPGGYDYEAFLFQRRIRAKGYVLDGDYQGSGSQSLDGYRFELKTYLAQLSNMSSSGLFLALSLGDRSRLTDQQWSLLKRTGTNHLIAISGLHIGLAALLGVMIGSLCGRFLSVWRNEVCYKDCGALFGLITAASYAALSGFGIPTQRALVMVAIVLLGVILRQRALQYRTLCLAFLGLLIWDPFVVLDPGLWLSFFAVAIIISQVNSRKLDDTAIEIGKGGGRANNLLFWIKLQAILSLAMFPMVLLFFSEGSLVSIPANLVAVPLVSFALVPLCLFTMTCLSLDLVGLALVNLELFDFLSGWLMKYLSMLAELPFSVARISFPQLTWLCLTVGVGWYLICSSYRKYWAVCVLLVFFVPTRSGFGEKMFEVVFLDVGQGLSVVVHTLNHTLLYDAGPRYRSGFNLGEVVVIPYLNARGVSHLDGVVISHGDNDHIGGAEVLLERFPVNLVLSSVAESLPSANYCVAGQKWEWDGVVFEILSPFQTSPKPHNNASCVLRISTKTASVLLTGDIEQETELQLIAESHSISNSPTKDSRGGRLRSDVMLAPHHGSKSSSIQQFIDAVSPRWVVVSAGYLNRYRHPNLGVVQRYQSGSSIIHNTASDGAVIVRGSPTGLQVSTWREQSPRIWHDRARYRPQWYPELP